MLVETLGATRFWLRDSEMIAMAVAGGKSGGGGKLSWGKMKLGQMVVLVDLTTAVRRLGQEEEGLVSWNSSLDASPHSLPVRADASCRFLFASP